jgi:hypothetical protein
LKKTVRRDEIGKAVQLFGPGRQMVLIGLLGDIFGIDTGQEPLICGHETDFTLFRCVGETKTAQGLVNIRVCKGTGGDIQKTPGKLSVKAYGPVAEREFHIIPVTEREGRGYKPCGRLSQQLPSQGSLDLMFPFKAQMLKVAASAPGEEGTDRVDTVRGGVAVNMFASEVILFLFSEPGPRRLFADIGIEAEKIAS